MIPKPHAVFRNCVTWRGLAVMLALGCFPCATVAEETSAEALPAEAPLVSLHAEPASIQLNRRQDYAQLLVFGRLASGETIDVTRMVTIATAPAIVQVSATGMVHPLTDGQGVLTCTLGKQSLEVPVECAGVGGPLEVDYIFDVMPVVSKMGCNAGTCHGSKKGKNGFKLSLRGYDPVTDLRAWTDDLSARRINRASPENSLMVLKATGSVPHGGGQVTKPGSIYHEILKTWIAEGTKLDLSTPRVAKIELIPQNPVVPREQMKQQMRVLATYADGRVRDVTAEAFMSSGNTDVLEADNTGLMTALRRGEAPVLARFEGQYTATTVTVMGDRTGFVWDQPPVNNFIDEYVYQKLEKIKALPSPLCSDEDFLRRVTLDLTGLPPTADQVRAFLANNRESWRKRRELVDQLIGSTDYIEHWTNKWADLLQVNRKFLGVEGAAAFRAWIRNHVESNTPYDQFAYAVLSAQGSNRENPAASYYKILREPTAMMENTTHLFLATRFNCNKCHDHPFERWTQDQYYQLSAYFARVELKKDPKSGDRKIGGTAVESAKPFYEIAFDNDSGEMLHERTGQVAPPQFPFSHEYKTTEGAVRREELARWITSKENPYFAMSYVNRAWGYLLGRGIIDPIDDIRAGNPPSHPELLAELTRRFVDSGFNVQDLLRTICTSRTYQHSIATNPWNEDDSVNFSHAAVRRLPAEVMYDAIHSVLGAKSHFPGVPAGTRAAALTDSGVKLTSGFLAQFGRPARESACECERSNNLMLGSVMALVNGPTVAAALTDSTSELAAIVQSEPDDQRVVQELYLRILNRPATSAEIETCVKTMRSSEADFQRLQAMHKHNTEAIAAYRTTLPEKMVAWEKAKMPPDWQPLDLFEFATTNGAALTKESDGSWVLSGKNGKSVYSFKAKTTLAGITGIRLELIADDRLPGRGPGRAKNGNLVLSEITAQLAAAAKPDEPTPITFAKAKASFSQNNYSVDKAIDGDLTKGGWAIAPQFGKNHTAFFQCAEPVGGEGGSVLSFELIQNHGSDHTLGRFRLLATSSPEPLRPEQPAALVALLKTPLEKRSGKQQAALLGFYRRDDPTLRKLESAVAASQLIVADQRQLGAQDVAWALINSPAFLFNR